jgi:hypothetical protein
MLPLAVLIAESGMLTARFSALRLPLFAERLAEFGALAQPALLFVGVFHRRGPSRSN